MRSLHERFAYKVIAIEEARDLNIMKLNELMDSFQNFELNLKQNKKDKSITLQAKKKQKSSD